GNSIDALRAKMALKCFNDTLRPVAEHPCYFNIVAIKGQHRLQGLDRLTCFTPLKEAAAAHWSWFDPMADTRVKKSSPRKIFTRVHLANRRYIGMTENPFGGNIPPLAAITTQS